MSRPLSASTISCHDAELKAFSTSTVVRAHKSLRPQHPLFAVFANFMPSLVDHADVTPRIVYTIFSRWPSFPQREQALAAPACDVPKLQALKTLRRSHDFLDATLVPSNADLSSF
jgi:hypothetical protein